MKVDTKEKYERLHKPIKPKSRVLKKVRDKISETFKFTRPVPYIPDKDKTNRPFNTSQLKRNFSLFDLLFGKLAPVYSNIYWSNSKTNKGNHKHASEVRATKKAQRRKAYHRMCRA